MIGQERNEVGASTLIALLILNKEAPDWRTLDKKHLLYVMISGAAMGCASLPNEDAPRKRAVPQTANISPFGAPLL